MTVKEYAKEIRETYGTDCLNLSQVAKCIGYDRKTAKEKVKHLPVIHDGGYRWRVRTIAEYLYVHEERGIL